MSGINAIREQVFVILEEVLEKVHAVRYINIV